MDIELIVLLTAVFASVVLLAVLRYLLLEGKKMQKMKNFHKTHATQQLNDLTLNLDEFRRTEQRCAQKNTKFRTEQTCCKFIHSVTVKKNNEHNEHNEHIKHIENNIIFIGKGA